jgi:hypothetical protein
MSLNRKSRLFLNCSIAVVLFVISILVRLDNLKEPIGKHHEWLTGHVLSTISIFEKNSVSQHYFSPVWTFNSEADRYLAGLTSFKDKNNYAYYVSYPPLCFLLPHFIFKATFTSASVTGIRIIGLFIHFFTAFFVLLIIYRAFDKKPADTFFIPAFAGFFLYVFASGNLWFHANVFFADTLVPLFISLFIYSLIKIKKGDHSLAKGCLLLFTACFLGSYTEWQMLFVAFLGSAYFFIKSFRERKNIIYFLSICAGTLLPLLITFYQYSQICGMKQLIEIQKAKYKQRSGTNYDAAEAGYSMQNSFSYANLSAHYERNYNTLLDFSWYCLLLLFAFTIRGVISKEKLSERWFLVILAGLFATIIIHHLAFFNFTAVHDFSTVKISLLLCLFCGYVIGLLFSKIDTESFSFKLASGSIAISCLIYFHFSINKYYDVNNPEELMKGHKTSGDVIRKNVDGSEMVFSDYISTPETYWYAQRNVITVPNINEAIAQLNFHHYPKNGAFLHMGAENMILIKFNAKGDTLSHQLFNY